MKCFLHAKIHKAIVTEANKDYVGSITIDKELLSLTGISVWEKVLVTNNTNGSRLETYVIPGKKGEICMNGPAAYLMKPKDEIVIMAFSWTNKPIKPKIILIDKNNNFLKNLTEKPCRNFPKFFLRKNSRGHFVSLHSVRAFNKLKVFKSER